MDPFPHLYQARAEDIQVFQKYWSGPQQFKHAEKTLIARVPKAAEDGYAVEIYCYACPARSYEVAALPGPNSMNEHQQGFSLCTGSGPGMAQLALELATHLSEGMLNMRIRKPQPAAGAQA